MEKDPIFIVTTKDKRREADSAALGVGFVLLFWCLVFAPIFGASFWVYQKLVSWQVHELFSFSLAAMILIIISVLMLGFRWVRVLYFGSVIINVAVIIFTGTEDHIWGSFFVIIWLFLGAGIAIKFEEFATDTTIFPE